MKSVHTVFASLALAGSLTQAADLLPRASSTSSSALPAITVQGNAFYAGDSRFYIRGVDYQPGGSSSTSDPLADSAGCTRDVPEFQKLGLNAIRVYSVDNNVNHDDCMNMLSAAGIYLILDTDNSQYSLNRDDPAESYNSVYLQSVFATVDAFAGYNNTMAFLSGNEVINTSNNTDCAPYVKAVTRDIKNYIIARGYRSIPVGYSAADVSTNQYLLGEYLNCGSDDVRSDFYAINDYSWCDPSSFTTSGWSALVEQYTGFGIPVFMSEYGCITNTRTFQEVGTLYSTEMTGVFSGGLVYEYSQEGNDYGLVTISGDSVTTDSGFTYLQSELANTTDPSGDGGATSTSAASTCPTESSDWDVSNDLIPVMPAAAEVYFKDGAGTGPGLTGPGSQDSGNSSTDSSASASGSSLPSQTTTATSESTGTATAASASASSTKKSEAVQAWSVEQTLGSTILLGIVGGMVYL